MRYSLLNLSILIKPPMPFASQIHTTNVIPGPLFRRLHDDIEEQHLKDPEWQRKLISGDFGSGCAGTDSDDFHFGFLDGPQSLDQASLYELQEQFRDAVLREAVVVGGVVVEFQRRVGLSSVVFDTCHDVIAGTDEFEDGRKVLGFACLEFR